MKTLLVSMAVVLLLAMSAFAQDEATGLTGKGFKVGVNMSDVYGDDAEGSDMKLGFGGGGFITYHFAPQFAIQPEVLYMMKGAKDAAGNKLKLSYIEVPLLLKFTPQTEGNLKPAIFAGPAIALMMGAKAEDFDVKDMYKSMDLGVAVGAGFGYKMETMTITFDARYTLGMMKTIDYEEYNKLYEPDPGEEATEDPDLKNSNISVMVGLSF